jgi:integrase
VTHDGREYPLVMDRGEWRLRSRSKTHPADFRTGTSNTLEAKRRAKEWLSSSGRAPLRAAKGGGDMEGVAQLYLATPKRTKNNAAKGNVSRLRTICRVVFNRELKDITCREFTSDAWRDYQRKALEKCGKTFDLTTRNVENNCINTAIRMARCVFLPHLIETYRAADFDIAPNCAKVVALPAPKVPVVAADDSAVLQDWPGLLRTDAALWLTIGLARFAGLRRSEIMACRGTWIEKRGGAVFVVLHDRPEEGFQTKTGSIYRAQVIDTDLADYLATIEKPDTPVVKTPEHVDRLCWFSRAPQEWLQARGIVATKPLHRLRGLYADDIARLTADAVAARLAGVREAAKSLGHTTTATTERHYLTPE